MTSAFNRQAVSALAAAAAAGLLLPGGAAHAETYNQTSGTTSWNSAANWVEGTVPNAPGAVAVFPGNTAARTSTLDADISVGSITIANGTATTTDIAMGSSTGGLFFDGAGAAPATVTVTGAGSPLVDGAGQNRITATMNLVDSVVIDVQNNNGGTTGAFSLLGIVQGAGGVTKTGSGRMTWAFTPGTNDRIKTYTGPTVINNGRVRMSIGARPTATSGFTIEQFGQFVPISAGTYSFNNGVGNLSINGNGPVAGPDAASPGAILPDANLDVVFTNPVFLPEGTGVVHSRKASASATGSITFENATSGPGVLQLTPSGGDGQFGTYFLKSTANSHTGGTVAYGGTVDATQGSLGAPTAPLTVNSILFGGGSQTTVLLNASTPTTTGSLSGTRLNPANPTTINNSGQLYTANQTTNGTYDGAIAGAGGFRLGSASTATLTLTGASTYAGGTDVQGGTLVVGNVNALGTGGLSVANGATARLQAGLPTAVSLPAPLGITAAGATGGTLDITNNGVAVRHADQAAAVAGHAAVNALVRNAFNEFQWNQPGVTSSTVAADVAAGIPAAVGILLNNDGGGNALFYGNGTDLPQFEGRSVDGNSVLVKDTLLGDGDLNGTVDSVDFALFQAGYTGAAPYVGFAFGDYDYNGVIDSVDFGLFQAGYQYSQSNPTPEMVAFAELHHLSLVAAAVPEPTTVGLLALAAGGLLARRRRTIGA